MKSKLLILSLTILFAIDMQAQSKLVKKIEQSQFFVTLLMNKSKLQSFANPSVKGSVSAYLSAVNANPACVKPETFIALRNEYYRIIDGVNNNIDGIITVISEVNRVQDLRNLVTAKPYIDSINKYAGAAPALFAQLIKAEGQTLQCNYGSGTLILTELVNLAMPFINQIFQNKIRKVKLVLIEKLNQMKFDRMTTSWDAAYSSIRGQQKVPSANFASLQLASKDQTGSNELTKDGAFRELGLSNKISCYTISQINEAYNGKLEEFKDIWSDPDFVKPEEVVAQKNRLLEAKMALYELFMTADCNKAATPVQ